MGFYFHRIPSLVQFLFPKHIWRLPNSENRIFLTFDDGPNPEATEFVLNLLEQYSIKATFFLLGEQVEKHDELVKRMKVEGHCIANHGYSHLDAKRISTEEYFSNKNKGQSLIDQMGGSTIFRPPYGRFHKGDQTMLWSLMAGDFDSKLTKEKCLKKLQKNTRSGDIIVFHDNLKSLDKLKWVLPKYLQSCLDQGFRFGLIDDEL